MSRPPSRPPRAGRRADAPDPSPLGPEAQAAAGLAPVSATTLAEGAMSSFAASRDELMAGVPTESLLPGSEEAFHARDPFSADYAEFLRGTADRREVQAPRVDTGLRTDLLAHPYLLARPEEAAQRGAAAVWRSLRNQLLQDPTALPDSSTREELQQLRRDIGAQKLLVDSVARGIDMQLRRIDQRLAEFADPAKAAPAPDAGKA